MSLFHALYPIPYLCVSTTVLGHVVGHEGVATDPDKIKAVTEWPRPTTVAEVRSFLGFVSYYRRFIPSFSKVAKPLNTLLQILEGTSHQKKKFKVNWGPEQQEAFETKALH